MENFNFLILILIGLPTYIIVSYLAPIKWQKIILVVGSLLFYIFCSKFSFTAFLFLLVSSYVNCMFNKALIKNHKSFLLFIFVVINIAAWIGAKILGVEILGISFWTFTIIGALIDSYKYKTDIELKDWLIFVFAFPKLMMGPIARYNKLESDIKRLDKYSCIVSSGVEEGLKLFILGLAMKTLIADELGTMWNSICVSGVLGISTATAWLGAFSYTIELYMDFWGYSLIAIGLGKIIGLSIPENFNDPYMAKSVSDFWRRWHITLGTWFRDYVYIPLGGNREGKFGTVTNLLIVWVLTGLWHGLGLNFILWGLVLGIIIIFEKMTPFGKLVEKNWIGHIYLPVVMLFTWMIFAMNDVNDILVYIKCMIGIYSPDAIPANGQAMRYLFEYWPQLLAGIALMVPSLHNIFKKISNKKVTNILLIAIFWICIYVMYTSDSNPFMYAAF